MIVLLGIEYVTQDRVREAYLEERAGKLNEAMLHDPEFLASAVDSVVVFVGTKSLIALTNDDDAVMGFELFREAALLGIDVSRDLKAAILSVYARIFAGESLHCLVKKRVIDPNTINNPRAKGLVQALAFCEPFDEMRLIFQGRKLESDATLGRPFLLKSSLSVDPGNPYLHILSSVYYLLLYRTEIRTNEVLELAVGDITNSMVMLERMVPFLQESVAESKKNLSQPGSLLTLPDGRMIKADALDSMNEFASSMILLSAVNRLDVVAFRLNDQVIDDIGFGDRLVITIEEILGSTNMMFSGHAVSAVNLTMAEYYAAKYKSFNKIEDLNKAGKALSNIKREGDDNLDMYRQFVFEQSHILSTSPLVTNPEIIEFFAKP